MKYKGFDKILCEEINVLNFTRVIGKDEKDRVIKLVYSLEEDGYYWLHGDERKEVKNEDNLEKLTKLY